MRREALESDSLKKDAKMQNAAQNGKTKLAEKAEKAETKEISAPNAYRELNDRRKFTIRTLIYGVLRPRRKSPRRGDDTDSYHVDFFNRELMLPAIGTVLLSSMDALLTLIAIDNRLAREANAAMASLMETSSASFAGWKLFGTIVGVVLLVSMANMRVLAGLRAIAVLYVMFGGYVLLVIYQLLHILTS